MTIETRPNYETQHPGSGAYLDAVRSVIPGIRARGEDVERGGRLHEDTVREFDEIGVFRGLQPRRWGGLELDPATFYESVALIGSACGSTGWVAGVVGVHPWEVALLPERAQRDVWGTEPLTRLSSSYAPTGNAVAVDGGYRLSGQWRFSSGADLCDWAILGGIPAGESETDLRAFLVPHADYTVDPDSWKVAGLCGTGSKALEVTDAFVPGHRSHKLTDVNRGIIPGWDVNDGPLYHMPWMAGIFGYTIAAAAIGAATGALAAYVEQTRTRYAALGGPPVAANPAIQFRLADALAEVEDCHQRMLNTWQEFYALACGGMRLIPADLQARSRHEAARAISRCLHAVLSVFEVAGGAVMSLSNPIQRFLRDLLAMRNHPMASLEATAATYARSQLNGPGSQ